MEEHELPEKLRGMGLQKADGIKRTIYLSDSKVDVLAKIFADVETRKGEKGA